MSLLHIPDGHKPGSLQLLLVVLFGGRAGGGKWKRQEVCGKRRRLRGDVLRREEDLHTDDAEKERERGRRDDGGDGMKTKSTRRGEDVQG